MADQSQVEILRSGVVQWNEWRRRNSRIVPDLAGADLRRFELQRANLKRANLRAANLWHANLENAKLQEADLRQAVLNESDLTRATLTNARLNEAKLYLAKANRTILTGAVLNHAILYGTTLAHAKLNSAQLYRANLKSTFLPGTTLANADLRQIDLSDSRLVHSDLSGADLTGANLVRTSLVDCNLEGAVLDGCAVYGISAWNLRLDGATQKSLVITPENQTTRITLDNLEIAQFIYLLLNNERIRKAIDTITSKVVLILGRFTPDRKLVLDAVRDELRKRDYIPVLFDFDQPSNQTTLETVNSLASLSRFVIADLTDARSVLQELSSIVPGRTSLPVQPILLADQVEPGMFDHFRMYPWVLQTRYYESSAQLLANIGEWVIEPAALKAAEQIASRTRA